MKNLTPSQLKTLSEFLNTVAAAWFTAGVISPIFVKPEDLSTTINLAFTSLVLTSSFLGLSLLLVRKLKI